MSYDYRKELSLILKLAFPVMLAQLAQTGITFAEAVMAGHYPDDGVSLSGVALGVAIWLPCILFAQGLLSILTPLISNLNGSAKRDQIANHIRQGLIIASILSVMLMLIFYHSDLFIGYLSSGEEESQDLDAMLNMAVNFLRAIMWGVPGFLFYLVYRFQCEGVSHTKPIMFIMISALIINIPINYIFIYGKFGLPELGGVGCGVAAAIIFWCMFFFMRFYTYTIPSQRDLRPKQNEKWIDLKLIKSIVLLGLPLGFSYLFEISLFTVITLLIAPLGKNIVASHQIIFQISSITFSIPLAIGIATSIRVGFLLGKQQPDAAKLSSYISLVTSFCAAIIVAIILLIGKTLFISAFTQVEAIIDVALKLIMLLALYQVFDYIQVTGSNILRAYKDTRSILIITFISYWIVGLPTGYILGLTDLITQKMGVSGFWIGINAGLGTASILLLSRIVYIQKRAPLGAD